jgi:hypothetical protein
LSNLIPRLSLLRHTSPGCSSSSRSPARHPNHAARHRALFRIASHNVFNACSPGHKTSRATLIFCWLYTFSPTYAQNKLSCRIRPVTRTRRNHRAVPPISPSSPSLFIITNNTHFHPIESNPFPSQPKSNPKLPALQFLTSRNALSSRQPPGKAANSPIPRSLSQRLAAKLPTFAHGRATLDFRATISREDC